MDQYIAILLGFGLASLSMAYIPVLSKRLKVTYALPVLFLGILLYYLNVPIDWPKVSWDNGWVKIVTELIVVISLMGAGLKIGFRYGRKHWKNPLRLIHTTMPLFMLAIFLLSYFMLGMDGATSLLLAAVCAPTDPVMASELQLEEHKVSEGRNTGMRYMLTAEAGLNDGMAFPFVYMAIIWNRDGAVDLWEWSGYYLLYKIVIGAVVGSLLGYCYSWSIDRFKSGKTISALSGFVSVALAIASFAAAEAVSGYGFLSAFFTGLFAQFHNHKREDDHSKEEMVLFTEETEKFMTVIFILVFGGLIANGILANTDIKGIFVAIAIVLVLRPVSGLIGIMPTSYTIRKKLAISFFGIKGIGSIFYLAYALDQTDFGNEAELYSIVSWVILISIVVHGTTALRAISYFKRHNPG